MAPETPTKVVFMAKFCHNPVPFFVIATTDVEVRAIMKAWSDDEVAKGNPPLLAPEELWTDVGGIRVLVPREMHPGISLLELG